MRRSDPAEIVRGGDQQTVVRADEEPSLAGAQRERAALPADTRIDHGQVDALGHVRQRVAEHERALEHVLRRDPVRDVDDFYLRRDSLDHAVARADEVVLQPEVGEERDDHGAGC